MIRRNIPIVAPGGRHTSQNIRQENNLAVLCNYLTLNGSTPVKDLTSLNIPGIDWKHPTQIVKCYISQCRASVLRKAGIDHKDGLLFAILDSNDDDEVS